MSTILIICNTCGHDSEQPDANRPGEQMAKAVETAMLNSDNGDITLRRYGCLMACRRHCTVQLRAPGKIGYVLGDFSPDVDAVDALMQYTRLYGASITGQVPYRDWPKFIKGKFIARIPVLEISAPTASISQEDKL
ncbi:MAG: hypothetical protein A3F41_02475 [Coxiella sp. RIFCSPHIGHO2_12_FULL_44_14]|nr:MAG: hypothetical protein A3F41_02475 [Coxiella sp. RIFCSPHIGHO2_12_FULL_44_14]